MGPPCLVASHCIRLKSTVAVGCIAGNFSKGLTLADSFYRPAWLPGALFRTAGDRCANTLNFLLRRDVYEPHYEFFEASASTALESSF
ncbi:MAG: hypothetical protein G01um101419_115 [Parcubacteria group bacterium Gr01-1014_19]|nr:MAG: hypothetical protein G01um101419_115 [Parcubacteria group bacterium Gr01-1014_19]